MFNYLQLRKAYLQAYMPNRIGTGQDKIACDSFRFWWWKSS